MGTTANQKKLFFNLRKAQSRISILDDGDMRLDQVRIIARRIGVTETDVIYMNRRLSGDASLNAAIREDGDSGEWQGWLGGGTPAQETTPAAGGGGGQPPARGAAAGGGGGLQHPPQDAVRCALCAQRARAAHLRGAPAGRGPDHARGPCRGVRCLARARAPDRGARL